MSDFPHDREDRDDSVDGPSEDATADIEERQDDDEGDGGRAPEDAPAY
jgi:hypothetical protein